MRIPKDQHGWTASRLIRGVVKSMKEGIGLDELEAAFLQLEKAISLIQRQVQTALVGHWFAVEDRVPADDTPVLIANERWEGPPVIEGYCHGGKWYTVEGFSLNTPLGEANPNHHPSTEPPTHWMRLPVPPWDKESTQQEGGVAPCKPMANQNAKVLPVPGTDSPARGLTPIHGYMACSCCHGLGFSTERTTVVRLKKCPECDGKGNFAVVAYPINERENP